MNPPKIPLSARIVRAGVPPITLTHLDQLQEGDTVHMLSRAGRMVLIYEGRGEYAVMRCHKLAMAPYIPRGKGYGTRFHRAVEDRVRELGLHFCTADDATVHDNEVTTAMRNRLLALYDHVRVGDAYVLLGDRRNPDHRASGRTNSNEGTDQ